MSTPVERISTGYTPRPIQAKLHISIKRFSVIVAHRRFGKSVFCLNHMIDQGLRNSKINPRYAYIAPLYSQAKRVAWDYLKLYALKIPGAIANEADLRVDIPRPDKGDTIRFTLLGADNPQSLKGIYLDGVILDEYADMNPVMWGEIIRPALADRLGWAIFIGTPKGQNSFYEMYMRAMFGIKNPETFEIVKDPEWFGAMYKASETGVVPQSELDAAKAEMTEDEYEQEFECSFHAQLVGAYFKKELAKAEKDGRIDRIPHDPMLPVDLYFDLGINDMAAVWFIQSFRGRHRAIDYYEVSGASIPEFVAEIKRRPYNFGRWVFPHDAQARDFSTGKSQLQIFRSLGARNTTVVPRVGTKRESINAARMIFGAVEFDRDRCKRGLECLTNYQRKWDSKNNVFAETPLHNWASNGCFTAETLVLTRYGKRQISMLEPTGEVLTLCGWKRYINPRLTRKNAPLVAVTFDDGLTVKCTPEHLFLTENGWKSAESLLPGSLIQSALTQSPNFLMAKSTECTGLRCVTSRIVGFCIEKFGHLLSEKYQLGVIFTTKMATEPTIESTTLSAYRPENTSLKPGKNNDPTSQTTLAKKLETKPQNGINQKRVDCGTAGICHATRYGKSGSVKSRLANAAKRLWELFVTTDTLKNGVQTNVECLRISDVVRLSEQADVWDITVPEIRSFSLENGAVVHNSDAFQCFAMGSRDDSRETSSTQFQNSRGELMADTDFNPYTRSM